MNNKLTRTGAIPATWLIEFSCAHQTDIKLFEFCIL